MFDTKSIVSRFSDYFNKRPDSNLSKIIALLSAELTEIHDTNAKIKVWRDIDRAEGFALDLIGENINQPRGTANDEVYRILLKSKLARNLSDGTLNTIINVLAIALSTSPSEIGIEEKWYDIDNPEPAAIKVTKAPFSKINESGLDPTNFVRIIQKTVAAGVKVESVELSGTFEFGTTAMQQDNNKGFGNVEQTAGGYFGLIIDGEAIQELPI